MRDGPALLVAAGLRNSSRQAQYARHTRARHAGVSWAKVLSNVHHGVDRVVLKNAERVIIRHLELDYPYRHYSIAPMQSVR